MAKLNVLKINDKQVSFEGNVYEETDLPVAVGDIVRRVNSASIDLTIGAFYKVESISESSDDNRFTIRDDVNDSRDRTQTDPAWAHYRKVADTVQPTTLVIEQPVHLVIKNIASITFEGGVVGATTV